MTFPTMTAGQLEILRIMEEDGEELVQDGREVWLGYTRRSPRTVYCLLRVLAITDVGEPGLRRYIINSTGEAIRRRPELAPEVYAAVHAGKPFTIRDGRVELLPAP